MWLRATIYFSVKFTVTVRTTGTGRPPTSAGVKRQPETVSIATRSSSGCTLRNTARETMQPVTLDVPSSFATLSDRIAPGPTIYITNAAQQEVRGRLVRLSNASLTLLIQGQEQEFAHTDFLQVAKRGDSLSNGMTIGCALGGGLGFLSLLTGGCEEPLGVGGASWARQCSPGWG